MNTQKISTRGKDCLPALISGLLSRINFKINSNDLRSRLKVEHFTHISQILFLDRLWYLLFKVFDMLMTWNQQSLGLQVFITLNRFRLSLIFYLFCRFVYSNKLALTCFWLCFIPHLSGRNLEVGFISLRHTHITWNSLFLEVEEGIDAWVTPLLTYSAIVSALKSVVVYLFSSIIFNNALCMINYYVEVLSNNSFARLSLVTFIQPLFWRLIWFYWKISLLSGPKHPSYLVISLCILLSQWLICTLNCLLWLNLWRVRLSILWVIVATVFGYVSSLFWQRCILTWIFQ